MGIFASSFLSQEVRHDACSGIRAKSGMKTKSDPAVALIGNLSLQLRLKAEPEWDLQVIAI